MSIEVYARELLNLTAEDLGDDAGVVRIKDLENETGEHLAHLRELARQREQKSHLQPVHAAESPPSSLCSSRSRTPVVDEEEEIKKNPCREKQAYDALIADGGCPSHPFSLGFDVLYNPGEYQDILWFWHARCGGFGFEQEFRHQLIVWKDFRQFQERARKFYIPRNRFHEYENAIQESREDAQCKWVIRVHEDQHKQNRLEDWNEFRSFYFHNKLKTQRMQVLPAKKEFFDYWKQLEEIEPGLGGIPPPIDLPPGENFVDAERRMKGARCMVEAAEQRLQQARSKCTVDKGPLIKTAQKELERAQEISWLQECISGARRDLGRELLDAKKWEVFVKWIDDQYSAIAAECGYPMDDFMRKEAPDLPSRSKGLRRQNRLSTRRSIPTASVLKLNPSSKISKQSMRKSSRHHKAELVSSDIAQATAMQDDYVETTTPWSGRLRQSGIHRPNRSVQIVNLGTVCSSKIIKPKTTLYPTTQRESLKSGSRNWPCTAALTMRSNLAPRSRFCRGKTSFGTKGSSAHELNKLRMGQRIKAQNESTRFQDSK